MISMLPPHIHVRKEISTSNQGGGREGREGGRGERKLFIWCLVEPASRLGKLTNYSYTVYVVAGTLLV